MSNWHRKRGDDVSKLWSIRTDLERRWEKKSSVLLIFTTA